MSSNHIWRKKVFSCCLACSYSTCSNRTDEDNRAPFQTPPPRRHSLCCTQLYTWNSLTVCFLTSAHLANDTMKRAGSSRHQVAGIATHSSPRFKCQKGVGAGGFRPSDKPLCWSVLTDTFSFCWSWIMWLCTLSSFFKVIPSSQFNLNSQSLWVLWCFYLSQDVETDLEHRVHCYQAVLAGLCAWHPRQQPNHIDYMESHTFTAVSQGVVLEMPPLLVPEYQISGELLWIHSLFSRNVLGRVADSPRSEAHELHYKHKSLSLRLQHVAGLLKAWES